MSIFTKLTLIPSNVINEIELFIKMRPTEKWDGFIYNDKKYYVIALTQDNNTKMYQFYHSDKDYMSTLYDMTTDKFVDFRYHYNGETSISILKISIKYQ